MGVGARLAALEGRLSAMGRVVLALSGGADSSLLAAVASRVLGEGLLAVTVAAPYTPEREVRRASSVARRLGVRHLILRDPGALSVPSIRWNLRDRCYRCKLRMMRALRRLASWTGAEVADGTNLSDLREDRPGIAALGELGVASPLAEAGLSGEEVRRASRAAGLAVPPPESCLLTRLPPGFGATPRLLRGLDLAEEAILGGGASAVRVRVLSETSIRVEVPPGEMGVVPGDVGRWGPMRPLRELGFREFEVGPLPGRYFKV